MSLLSFNVCRGSYAHYIMYQNLESATRHQEMSGIQDLCTSHREYIYRSRYNNCLPNFKSIYASMYIY
jgi:hypothetical protein